MPYTPLDREAAIFGRELNLFNDPDLSERYALLSHRRDRVIKAKKERLEPLWNAFKALYWSGKRHSAECVAAETAYSAAYYRLWHYERRSLLILAALINGANHA